MSSADPASGDFVYDEFAYLSENLSDVGLARSDFGHNPRSAMQRVDCEVEPGRSLSALKWDEDPQFVFIHGTAQNAHTWDTVVLALGRSSLAIDLPGHGHSDWRDDRTYTPRNMADDMATMIVAFAPSARVVVGMSLGGMVATSLAAHHSHLVRRLLTVDVTPGVTREKAKHIHDFVAGPQDFPSFTEIFDRTIEFNPTRSASSLRRGIIHNAQKNADGSWEWRYDRRGRGDVASDGVEPGTRVGSPADLWTDVEATVAPHLLVRGGSEGSVVDDADVAELNRRRPDSQVIVVPDAGHSIQGDQPIELARIIGEFADAS